VELAVLVVANLAATLLRFVLLRHWVFRQRTTPTCPSRHAPISIQQAHTSANHDSHAPTDDSATPALAITEGHLR
jgi:hypothetical protein